jgi:urease accessory protein UreH
VSAAGSIALTCAADGGRTRLRALRCEGLSRASRAFAEPAGAIRLMLATLGPGVLGGDRFTLDGALDAAASLVAAGQMATPVFAGSAPSRSDARWRIGAGARLHVAGEPLLLEPGSSHAAAVTFALAGDAVALAVETFALRGRARLAMRAQATLDGRLVYRDAFDLDGSRPGAFGTVALIAADPALRAAFAQRAGAYAAAGGPVRAGVGETAAAVIVRLSAERVWDVQCAGRALAALVPGVSGGPSGPG